MSIYIQIQKLNPGIGQGSKDIGDYLPAHSEIEGPILQLKVLDDSEEAGLRWAVPVTLSRKGMPRSGRLWLVFALGFCGY